MNRAMRFLVAGLLCACGLILAPLCRADITCIETDNGGMWISISNGSIWGVGSDCEIYCVDFLSPQPLATHFEFHNESGGTFHLGDMELGPGQSFEIPYVEGVAMPWNLDYGGGTPGPDDWVSILLLTAADSVSIRYILDIGGVTYGAPCIVGDGLLGTPDHVRVNDYCSNPASPSLDLTDLSGLITTIDYFDGIGACCHEDGTCTNVWEEDCATSGVWQGEYTVCDPNPCEGPSAIEEASWGSVKARFR